MATHPLPATVGGSKASPRARSREETLDGWDAYRAAVIERVPGPA